MAEPFRWAPWRVVPSATPITVQESPAARAAATADVSSTSAASRDSRAGDDATEVASIPSSMGSGRDSVQRLHFPLVL